MEFLISRRAFRKRLAAVTAVIPRRTPRPVLESVRLEVDARGRGTLGATDLETWVRVKAPLLRVPLAGAAQLPARALLAALGKAEDRELRLDYDPEAFSLAGGPDAPPSSLLVAGSRTRLMLRTHRPEDFPARGEQTPSGCSEVELRHLRRLIRTTVFATDPRNQRFTLGGCWFGLGAGSIDAVATDGHRLAHAWSTDVAVIATPEPPAEHAPWDRSRALAPMIGGRALRVLDGLLEELGSPCQKASLAWTEDGCLRVETPGLSWVSRQLAGRFPRWREAFPPPSPHRGHWSRADLPLATLKQAKALTDRDHRAVRVGLRPGALTLTVRKADGGTCTLETCCVYRSEPASAHFDLARLIDVLSAIKGEPIDLELGGPGIPAVLHAAGFRCCVMPLPEVGEATHRGEPCEEGDREEGPADEAAAAPKVEEARSALAESATTA